MSMSLNINKRKTLPSGCWYDVTIDKDVVKTLVTYEPNCVDAWIFEVRQLHILDDSDNYKGRIPVGLDAEWTINFKAKTRNPVATLQLSIGCNCLIYQLVHSTEIPQSLKEFLADTNYVFMGVGIKEDVEKLLHDYDLVVSNTAELRELAAVEFGKEFRLKGLVGLAKEVIGKEFEKLKRITLSKWDKKWLSDEQVQYACVDAFISWAIGKGLMKLQKARFESIRNDAVFQTPSLDE